MSEELKRLEETMDRPSMDDEIEERYGFERAHHRSLQPLHLGLGVVCSGFFLTAVNGGERRLFPCLFQRLLQPLHLGLQFSDPLGDPKRSRRLR